MKKQRKIYDIEKIFRLTMAIGFALLSISPLNEKEVFEKLNTITEVIEVHPLFGEYDILVKINCNDIDEIGSIVINKIRATKGVVDTKTLIGTNSLKGEINTRADSYS